MKREEYELAAPILSLIGKHIIGEYGISADMMSALVSMTELTRNSGKRCKYEDILAESAFKMEVPQREIECKIEALVDASGSDDGLELIVVDKASDDEAKQLMLAIACEAVENMTVRISRIVRSIAKVK